MYYQQSKGKYMKDRLQVIFETVTELLSEKKKEEKPKRRERDFSNRGSKEPKPGSRGDGGVGTPGEHNDDADRSHRTPTHRVAR